MPCFEAESSLRLPGWLSARSVAFAAFVLSLTVVAVGGGFIAYEYGEIQRQAKRDTEQMVRLLEDHASRCFDGLDVTLNALEDSIGSTPSSVANAGPLLIRSISALTYLRSLSVVNGEGRVLASTNADNLDTWMDPGVVKLPSADVNEQIGDLVPGRDLVDARVGAIAEPGAARRNFIPVARRIARHAEGVLFLVAVLNPDFFASEQALILNQPDFNAALASIEGGLLTTSGNVLRMPGDSLADHHFFQHDLPLRESGSHVGPGLDGQTVLTAFRVLRRQPIVVIVELNHAVVAGRISQIALMTMLACLIAVFLIFTFAQFAWRSLRGHAAMYVALVASREERDAAERRMRGLVQSVHEVIFRMDSLGIVGFVNQRWEELTGRNSSDAVGVHLADLCLPVHRTRVLPLFAPDAPEHSGSLEIEVLGHDGAVRTLEIAVKRLIDASAQKIFFAGFALDVTERRRTRDALQAQMDFTSSLFEICPTPLLVKDHDGRYIKVNRAWLELMDLPVEKVLGLTSAEIFPNKATKHLEHDRIAFQQHTPIRYENRLVRPDMAARDTVVTKVRFTNPQGQPAGIIGSVVDVTEFREAERVTAEARDAAERANLAKSDFIATITHELRTPLLAIIGFSELGVKSARSEPDLQEMFKDVYTGGRRMLTLVNGLLDLAKMESTSTALSFAEQDLVVLTTTVMRELRPLAESRRLKFEMVTSASSIRIVVDGPRLEQVIRNILANAVRFAPEGSAIVIHARDLGADGCEWRVRDHGPGIPEDELELIFDAFVQSSRTRNGAGGTGLGLTICNRIVGAHGGRIEASNANGGGAAFSFWLPSRELRLD